LAIEAGALIEVAVKIHESLGVGVPVVGIGVHDLIRVGGEGEGAGAEGYRDKCAAKGRKVHDGQMPGAFSV
jgi:hypothetical protein